MGAVIEHIESHAIAHYDKPDKGQLAVIKTELAKNIMDYLAKNKRRMKANRYPFPVSKIVFTHDEHYMRERAGWLEVLSAEVTFARGLI